MGEAPAHHPKIRHLRDPQTPQRLYYVAVVRGSRRARLPNRKGEKMKLLAHRGTASAAEGGRASGVSRGVSPSALVRRSGLLAVASGVSVFLAPFLHPADPQSAAW